MPMVACVPVSFEAPPASLQARGCSWPKLTTWCLTKGLSSMAKRIEYFGGHTHGHIVLENGQRENLWFDRELWFDRDIDGRWLVGVTGQQRGGEGRTGAIVVKDATVTAFNALLGRLVVDPDGFADEHLIIGPDWGGRLPD
jgi:hypothetical protein